MQHFWSDSMFSMGLLVWLQWSSVFLSLSLDKNAQIFTFWIENLINILLWYSCTAWICEHFATAAAVNLKLGHKCSSSNRNMQRLMNRLHWAENQLHQNKMVKWIIYLNISVEIGLFLRYEIWAFWCVPNKALPSIRHEKNVCFVYIWHHFCTTNSIIRQKYFPDLIIC